jgi:hypothetical protein
MREERVVHNFDTYQYITDFKKQGFNEEQAKLIVRSILESREYDLSKLATKEQISTLKTVMDIRFDAMEEKFNSMEEKFNGKFDAIEEKFNSMEEKFNGKFDAIEKQMNTFVTKDDLKASLGTLKNDMLKWVISLIFANTAVIVAVIKLFLH